MKYIIFLNIFDYFLNIFDYFLNFIFIYVKSKKKKKSVMKNTIYNNWYDRIYEITGKGYNKIKQFFCRKTKQYATVDYYNLDRTRKEKKKIINPNQYNMESVHPIKNTSALDIIIEGEDENSSQDSELTFPDTPN